MNPDIKTLSAYKVKFAADPSRSGVISGYGSIAGNVDAVGDIVERGAFAKSLATFKSNGSTPRMLWQHNPDMPIGSWTDLHEDSNGLYLTGKMNLSTSWGKDAWAATEAGDVDGLSIGYREIKARPDGMFRRLEELELFEVSLVTFPANPKARVRLNSKRELETILVKSGLSQAAATKVAAGGWGALNNNPTDDDPEAVAAIIRAVKASTQAIRNI
ncbi:HK97 family phage prohead protease [Rhizobium sp. Leaf386]|uniref:HK97 family phage prohead protease n=1 Tax=Rhizobium sp. Leaf386 TaxID=1736359 RepID=UPI0007133485|nr:HK97 family phage prohead protease [Rhizobium sp. Leaf386]KQT04140.1 hypothetical protein ASG50_18245 [Rhizobium sp. Leaf386]